MPPVGRECAETFERAEQLVDVALVDPVAGVGDPVSEQARLRFGEAHRDEAAVTVVVHGVRQQVEQHLAQPPVVRKHKAVQSAMEVALDLDPALRGERCDHLQRVGQRIARMHGLDRFTVTAQLDVRDVEHLVDQFEEMPPGVHDAADVMDGVGRQTTGQQQLPETENAVQRCPELMTHPRQELALGSVCALGLVTRGLDRRLGP